MLNVLLDAISVGQHFKMGLSKTNENVSTNIKLVSEQTYYFKYCTHE